MRILPILLLLGGCGAISPHFVDPNVVYVDAMTGNYVELTRKEKDSGRFRCITDLAVLWCKEGGGSWSCECVTVR